MISQVFHLIGFFIFASYFYCELVSNKEIAFGSILYKVSPSHLIVEEGLSHVSFIRLGRRQGIRQVGIVQV